MTPADRRSHILCWKIDTKRKLIFNIEFESCGSPSNCQSDKNSFSSVHSIRSRFSFVIRGSKYSRLNELLPPKFDRKANDIIFVYLSWWAGWLLPRKAHQIFRIDINIKRINFWLFVDTDVAINTNEICHVNERDWGKSTRHNQPIPWHLSPSTIWSVLSRSK